MGIPFLIFIKTVQIYREGLVGNVLAEQHGKRQRAIFKMRIHGSGKEHVPQAHHEISNQDGKQRGVVQQHGDADELPAAGISQDAHDERFNGRNVGLLSQNTAGQPQEQVADINRHGPLDHFFIKMQG